MFYLLNRNGTLRSYLYKNSIIGKLVEYFQINNHNLYLQKIFATDK